MIRSIETYIVTDGNGKEAVGFYQDALNAKLIEMTLWKDKIPNCPKEYENLVLNAQLLINGIRLMISDNNPEFPYIIGTNLSPTIIVDSIEDSKNVYEKLSQDAMKIDMPLQETFWSPSYAVVTDKFGISWQINTEIK